MDMSGMTMDASAMHMVFFSSTNTPLFSKQWTPNSAGAYAGTCIFLIILAFLYRGLFTLKSYLEHRWLVAAMNRRFIVVADRTPRAEQIARDDDSKTGILTTNGVEENVRLVQQNIGLVQPWRFSVDLPRSCLVAVMVGIGYLL
jgi:solute carrier family 31 (copper transporter), member 1